VAGVRVAIVDHPELGWTATRADGAWDLVVQGGGELTVAFTHPDHPEAQRHVRWTGARRRSCRTSA